MRAASRRAGSDVAGSREADLMFAASRSRPGRGAAVVGERAGRCGTAASRGHLREGHIERDEVAGAVVVQRLWCERGGRWGTASSRGHVREGHVERDEVAGGKWLLSGHVDR